MAFAEAQEDCFDVNTLGLFATAVATHLGATRCIVIGDPADRLKLAEAWDIKPVILPNTALSG